MEDKLYDLMKRTNDILEKTKKQSTIYKNDRIRLLNYYNSKTNIEEWENFVKEMEEKIARS